MSFEKAFDRLIGHEGGYSNRDLKDDPGGETNWGITWPTLREAIGLGLVSAGTTIKDLTRDQAKTIYRALYWDRAKSSEYDYAIAYQLFDAAVNSGIGNAIRFLQRAVDVADDGSVGKITLAAIKAMTVTDVLYRMNAQRLLFMTKLSNWDANSRGWSRRIAGNLLYAAEDA